VPRLRLGVVSTYPPREDGIATYARDLLEAVCTPTSHVTALIAAITDPDAFYAYPRQVHWEIEQGNPDSYAEMGRILTKARVDVVSLQHEFGLFGDLPETGQDDAPALLEALHKPLVTTLHTVLPQPRPAIRAAVRKLCAHSACVIVMAHLGAKILAEDYDIERDTVVTIPHGVPLVRPIATERMKRALRLEGRTVIATFGLLRPHKGLEDAIRAMPTILEQYPHVLYLIMGETHPQVRKVEGERYRAELVALARELGVSRQVRFLNQYLEQQTLIRYLQATDIYLTPYHDRSQITSGTLAYALGCGRAIVSTPYIYAGEALAEGRGLLAEFESPESIARCVLLYLDNPEYRAQTQERALEYGRMMAWPQVGQQYIEVFQRAAEAKRA
jgi:glycosyltransferase involved in cell wall biosynthesis